MQNGPHLFERTLPLFLAILTAIVVVFQAQILLRVNRELVDLKVALVAAKSPAEKAVDIKPFAVLERECTDCHSERRFMGIHGTASELQNVVQHMENMPGARISPTDLDRIHGSLRLLQCMQCHDEGMLKKLGALGSKEQHTMIEKMAGRPGSPVSQEEIDAIQRGFQSIQGF